MIKTAFHKLNQWIEEQNRARTEEGLTKIQRVEIRVVGQTALVESGLSLSFPETIDVDAFHKMTYEVWKKFDGILQTFGRRLDPLSHEIWMPDETSYNLVYKAKWVAGFIAQPEYILISKALKAPDKNRSILIQYLIKGPSQKFLNLAKKYNIDFERFVL